MARPLRIALVVAAVAGAFAGGYLVKNSSPLSWAASKPVVVAEASPKAPAQAVTHTTVLAHRTVAMTATAPQTRTVPRTVAEVPDFAPPPMPAPQGEPSTIILPPTAVAEPPRLEPVDPNDPGFRMIRDAMGIKTTILDKAAPPPLVLANGKRDTEPDVLPPPQPMAGPPPKLESPRIDLGLPPMIAPPQESKPVPLLNSRAVELDFEVTRAGLSKVKAVELWVTRNGGANWTRTDRMDGARPPFRARLGSEGEYGFRMVFESEAGMRTPDPKPGQAPDLVMELDTTPPQIAIYPPKPIPGQPGRVILNWYVQDTHLDRDPSAMRLEYSADGQTWEMIERRGAAPGQNSHDWTLPAAVPPKVLLRVIARDKAGNMATAVTSEKVSVDLLAPEGKVTAVRAQGREPEKGPMPRTVRTGPVAGGPVPEVLRSVLPVVLGSPLLFPSFARPAAPTPHGPWAWDVRGNDLDPVPPPAEYVHDGSGYYWSGHEPASGSLAPFVSPKDWLASLTKADVVDERPAWTYQRSDPFAHLPLSEILPAEAERLLAQLHGRVRVYDPAATDVEWGFVTDSGTQAPLEGKFKSGPATRLMQERRQTAEATFEGFSRGQTVIKLLSDRDWTPSAATPESYRDWGRTAGRDRPFGGAYDTGPGYWGSFSTPCVLIDF